MATSATSSSAASSSSPPKMQPEDITITTTTFLIVGGGIAGISCMETLRFLRPDAHITLITESALVKTVTNLVPLAKCLTRFDVTEQTADELQTNSGSASNLLRLITGDRLHTINAAEHLATTASGRRIHYARLCLCTGARPHLIPQSTADSSSDELRDRVLGIRDTESVARFQQRIAGCRRLAIVGNGGIAAECVYAVRGVHVDWVIKDRFVAQTFVDPGAAEFFRTRIEEKKEVEPLMAGELKKPKGPVKRMRYEETTAFETAEGKAGGAALGPDWHRKWDLSARDADGKECESVTIHTETEIQSIETTTADSSLPNDVSAPYQHPLLLHLTNGKRLPCDLVVSATGVRPAITFTCLPAGELLLSPIDGGILVDHLQRTSLPDVYAAGDCCTANWQPLAKHWLQMRLWTQARQMGAMAARAMAADDADDAEILQDFCFELFGHVTQLFGYQVVLLGKFNGQGLGRNYEALIRMTPGLEYIKYVLQDGRVQGAILIGDTGLEETTENLILNQLDVSGYGEGLLDPDVDIEDYFD